MTPLDDLRFSFVALNETPQLPISFALVPALVDDFRAQGTHSERVSIKALEAWLALFRLTPRAVGEVLSVNATVTCIGSEPAQGKRLDHLEEALTRTAAQASALIEQSRREVERSRVLLKNEPRRDDGAPPPV